MIRNDLSDRLVHLTKGTSEQEVAQRFLSIVSSRALRGGTGLIQGSYQCVCFTETPISQLATILAQPSIHGMPYAPFGVMTSKRSVFAAGGRPVIYQPPADFDALPDTLKYRHKDYVPGQEPDTSWEREWRICSAAYALDPDSITLIVPNREWADYFFRTHAGGLAGSIMAFGEDAMFAMRKCPWHFLVLEDLGVPITFSALPTTGSDGA